MIATTYAGEALFVLPFWPEWPVNARLEMETRVDRSLSGREARRPLGETARVRLEFSVFVVGRHLAVLMAGLREWKDERVAVPFWPGVVPAEEFATMSFRAGIFIALSADESRFELFSGSVPGWVDNGDWIAPVLVGLLSRRNTITMLSASVGRFAVEFDESSAPALALTVASTAWETGPNPSSTWDLPPALFPFRLSFESPTNGVRVDIEAEQLGHGRERAVTFYDQIPVRTGDAVCWVNSGSEASELVRFFMDHGAGAAFWFTQEVQVAELASDVAAGAVTLPVLEPHAAKAGDWLMVGGPDDASASKVASVAAASITLASGIAVDLPLESTMVYPLGLVVFDRAQITVSWLSVSHAKATVTLREVPEEYTPAADEAAGETLGRIRTCALLVTITDGVDTVRFTNFERAISTPDGEFTPIPMGCSEIRRGTSPDNDEVSLEVDATNLPATHIIRRMASLRVDRPVRVTVLRITTD